MEKTEVTHQTINGKYRVVIERAASTKGTLGYKVEANGDEYPEVLRDIHSLQIAVELMTVTQLEANNKPS